MNLEWKLFAGAAGFAAVVSGIYWFAAYEHAGTTMLVLSGASLLLVAAYLAAVGGRSGPRPSDRPDAAPEEDDEAVYYPSSSVWPFVAGAGAVVLGNGLVFGAGVASLGVLLLVAGIVGYAREAGPPSR